MSGRLWDADDYSDDDGAVDLAAVLRCKPACFSLKKLRIHAVGKGLVSVRVRELHPRFLGVQSLYLCGNSLTSLRWVEYFRSLKRLSLADNLVQSLDEVARLGACEELQNVVLRGNPVEWRPFFGSHVRISCPQLALLDGRPLQNFALARERLRFENAVLSMLVEDFCAVHVLQFSYKVCRMHAELVRCTVRYPSISFVRRAARESMRERSWAIQAREVVSELASSPPSSERMGALLQLWRFKDLLEEWQVWELQEALSTAVTRSSGAAVRRRVLLERANRLPYQPVYESPQGLGLGMDSYCNSKPGRGVVDVRDTWEARSFAWLSSKLKDELTHWLTKHDEQRQLDRRWVQQRPRIGEQTSTRRILELEAEKALRWEAQQVRVVRDLLQVVHSLGENNDLNGGGDSFSSASGFRGSIHPGGDGNGNGADAGERTHVHRTPCRVVRDESLNPSPAFSSPFVTPLNPGQQFSCSSSKKYQASCSHREDTVLPSLDIETSRIASTSERMLKAFTPEALVFDE